MKLVPYNKNDIEGYVRGRNSNNYKLLMDFYESDDQCVKIEDYPHKTAESLRASLLASIKRYHLNSIRVVVRGENVFLLKVDL